MPTQRAMNLGLYSPRMWRWSFDWWWVDARDWVFSTYVEVILSAALDMTISNGILHVCGGDPASCLLPLKHRKYSPRMWRWSSYVCPCLSLCRVFSTYVEVIPSTGLVPKVISSILHVCGGDPYWAKRDKAERAVFSTYVEVILTEQKLNQFQTCILHVCGGDPVSARQMNPPLKVFSTYVEVILLHNGAGTAIVRILHVCGGDPVGSTTKKISGMYSPRMWRWSSTNKTVESLSQVFSTYVEVILKN